MKNKDLIFEMNLYSFNGFQKYGFKNEVAVMNFTSYLVQNFSWLNVKVYKDIDKNNHYLISNKYKKYYQKFTSTDIENLVNLLIKKGLNVSFTINCYNKETLNFNKNTFKENLEKLKNYEKEL